MKLRNKKKEIEMFFVALIIFIASLSTFVSSIVLLSPSGIIYDRSPIFIWGGFDENYKLLVDDNPDFNSPIVDVYVNGNQYEVNENLDIGEYYWKVIGQSKDKESITGRFALDSLVGYSIGGTKLRSIGNVLTKLNGITGFVILEPGEIIDIQEGNYSLEQHE
jgi:hypothetical protein